MKKDEKFSFPPQVLNQINECSSGGFILFTINSENAPEVFFSYDSEVSMIALRKWATDYLDNMDEIDQMMMGDAISNKLSDEDEDCD
jgi:hypothetical protein